MKSKIRINTIPFVLMFIFLGTIAEIAFSQPQPPGGPEYSSSAPITIYTPKNEPVNAATYTDFPQWVAYWESFGVYLITTNGWDAIREAPATHGYNCHGYAWHVSENGSPCWLNAPELPQYWTGNQSYIQAYTNAYGTKVKFTNDDHSAITTTSASYVRSKWAKLPMYKHQLSHCPYNSSGVVYYRLNVNMTGSSSLLCQNVERSFSTNITNMTGYFSDIDPPDRFNSKNEC